MYHVLCWFIVLFRLLSVIVTFYSKFQTVILYNVASCWLYAEEYFNNARSHERKFPVSFHVSNDMSQHRSRLPMYQEQHTKEVRSFPSSVSGALSSNWAKRPLASSCMSVSLPFLRHWTTHLNLKDFYEIWFEGCSKICWEISSFFKIREE
jgi:hypothetical protein